MATTNSTEQGRGNEPIAVIGSGCRFPGRANEPSKLWELLKEPKDLLTKIPKDRFNIDAFYHPDGTRHGCTNVQHSYFLAENTQAFDASFFNITPNEADSVDPQHRLLLETVYEALCTAGLKVEDLRGSHTAVYVGLMSNDYQNLLTRDLNAMPTYTATGISPCILSNRVSYFFDWHGPSMTMDTACSSSLVAVHQAVQTLRSGESKVAVCAGANLIFGPLAYIMESKLNMLSPDGRSRMWDAGANGYARGEGVATVVLKTLKQALQDGDEVECVIRETGVNQDGRSAGITMPNHAAQAMLIRDTYAKAGLDLSKASDRCQYFEAHGTGTPAGDPQEAQAIASAFFGQRERDDLEEPLYVGSIKTVIGHTEGTAGIAGLLKASLAVRHGVIPPNLLFESLSPKVAPFYHNLRILTEAKPWPTLSAGEPRRASVNSFGFGGTNAHAIIESYDNKSARPPTAASVNASVIPLVLSANSERSLKSTMEGLLRFLRTYPDTDMVDLAWTLLKKRSALTVRRALPAGSNAEASAGLEKQIAALRSGQDHLTKSQHKTRKPNVLGVFTGQGAQWPAMGKRLVESVPFARNIIEDLDRSLATLPLEYRPSWTLLEQMSLEGDSSNVKKAEYSQPLCTAVQVVLVKLLAASGVTITTAVGHSSGEIACAFAAGYITSDQAIRIAYLRGLFAKLAQSSNGSQGCMLAAGVSMEDAKELCELDMFAGRVCVAAVNSPESVTLSGDEDAIEQAQAVFEDESKFARRLKVDKAYHSHHMLPCAQPYVEALRACGCATGEASPTAVQWVSSVYEGLMMKAENVTAEYWKDNLISTVLFSQAIATACTQPAPLEAAVEVGCHPALKGPCLATLQSSLAGELPYTGCMQRGENDVDSFSNALGYLWEHFGSGGFDVDPLIAHVLPHIQPKSLAKALPQYPWDNNKTYWAATSRQTRALLDREYAPHPLLGTMSSHSTATSVQWHNFIRPRDIPWLDGHQLQGQIVLPGATYAVIALEAATRMAGGREIQLLEVFDLNIGKAVTFDDENSLVEVNLNLEVTADSSDSETLELRFTCDSCLAKEHALTPSASGRVTVTYGSASNQALPTAREEPAHMNDVSVDKFYTMLEGLGYGYSGDFVGLRSVKRVTGRSRGTIAIAAPWTDGGLATIHPATLDVAFQAFIGSFCMPGDGRLRSLHLPVSIGRIALNPHLCAAIHASSAEVAFNSSCTIDDLQGVGGDVEIFSPEDHSTIVQIESIRVKPFTTPTAADDRVFFAKMAYVPLHPDRILDKKEIRATPMQREIALLCERLVYFYVKRFLSEVTEEDRQLAAPHSQSFIAWTEHVADMATNGRHDTYDSSWDQDTLEDLHDMCKSYADEIDLRMINRAGANMLHSVRTDENVFELMNSDGLLTEVYEKGIGLPQAYVYLRELVTQITARFQSMDILEIGAGTGTATRQLESIPDRTYNSYTFTDLSPAFFERAQEIFKRNDRMIYKTLDICQKVGPQGFKEHSYDLLCAANVIHATPSLEKSLKTARSLLKPGGSLLLLEITNEKQQRIGFGFGQFSGWWAGVDEGRTLAPFVSIAQWNDVLQRTGFSAVDTRSVDHDADIFAISVFSAHAVEPRINFLESPLSMPAKENLPLIVIVGGTSAVSLKLSAKLRDVLSHRRFKSVVRLQDLLVDTVESRSTFVILSELDSELFADLNIDRYEGLRTAVQQAKNMIWVTENAWDDNPYQAMVIGMIRSLRPEKQDANMQVIDCDFARDLEAELLAEQVLRLEAEHGMSPTGLVWYNEPELRMEKGKLFVPRYQLDTARINRYNSAFRTIKEPVAMQNSPVALKNRQGEWYYQTQQNHLSRLRCTPGRVRVQAQYSLPYAIRIGNLGYFFLVQGHVPSTGKTVIALSETNASWCEVPESHMLPLYHLGTHEGGTLLAVAAELLSQAILAAAVPGSSTLVLEPPAFMTGSAIRAAERKGCHLAFIGGVRPSDADDHSWITLHGRESRQALQNALPKHIIACFDFGGASRPSGPSRRILDCLSSTCCKYGKDYLFQNSCVTLCSEPGKTCRQFLENAVAMHGAERFDITRVAAAQMATTERSPELSTVIDWTKNDVVDVRLQPIDSSDIFHANKTYWLIGLTGDLGRSLCRWMVLHGARNVVMSSRNPRIDSRWIAEMFEMGARVEVMPMDATKKAVVQATVAKIDKTMPPIAGIAFGPLVLQDILLENMDLGTFDAVLAPKVEGASNLNEIFDSTRELDFFVLVSSLAMIGGNPGQSAYNASNSFVRSLAAKRRKQGLAASCLNLGGITGVGFIAKAVREEEGFVISDYLFQDMSETDMHEQFGEAIIFGGPTIPKSFDDFEVSTGFPWMDPAYGERYPFYDDPRVGRFRLCDQRDKMNDGALLSAGPVRERLTVATCIEDVQQAIRDALIAKLRSALHLAPEDDLDEDLPLIDQGVDSLVAVALRTWFSKQLELDLPVLKVVGGASISDLVVDAADRLPVGLAPLVQGITDNAAEVSMPVMSPAAENIVMSNPLDAMLASTALASSHSSSSKASADGNDSDGESKARGLASPLTDYSPPAESDQRKNPFDDPALTSRLQRQEIMSFGQARFWLMRHLVDDPTTFNTSGGMWMEGIIDPVRLGRAVDQCTRRHEIFRTRFFEEDGRPDRPMQAVMNVTHVRFHDRPVKDRAAALEAFTEIERYEYNLETGDLGQVYYFHWGASESLFVVAYHHIISDGTSFQLIFNEIGSLYAGQQLPPPPQYADYALRQRKAYEAGDMDKDIAYWEAEYATLPPVLPVLPLASTSTRSKAVSWDYHSAFLRLPPMLAARIKGRSRKHKADPVHFYLAAFHALLARLTDSSDVVIGVNDANRQSLDDLSTIGFFINLLPVRLRYSTNQTFSESIVQARDKVREALLHSTLPFDILLQRLNIPRASTHAPLFQAGFDYKQGQAESGKIGDSVMTGVHLSRSRTAWDITLEVMDDATKDPQIGIKLQTSLYSKEDVMPILQSYLNLLTSYCLNPALRAEEPRLFARGDVDQALQLGKGSVLNSARPSTLPARIDEICVSQPDDVAIRSGLACLTYRELSARVNGIAAALSDRGIESGAIVASLQSPAPDWICSMLAIMAVGAVYVPVDPTLPAQRMLSILSDCKPSLVLTNGAQIAHDVQIDSAYALLDVRDISLSEHRHQCLADLDKPCAILYTSGTTGTPKGHLLTHAGILNNVEGSIALLNGDHQHVLQQSALTFDMSIWQALLGLASGGSVYVVPQQDRRDSEKISKCIGEQKASCMVATPLEYASWIQVGLHGLKQASAWKYALTGGEALTHAVLRKFHSLHLPNLRVYNSYGPAEVCFYSHAVEIDYRNEHLPERVPLGHAMPNYSTYIVDEDLRPVPAGFPGEILIGGPSVGQGYLNRQDLTAKAFIPDTFATPEEKARGSKMLFRSGDKGRLRPNGELLFDGRIGGGTQIKLRGIRIELQDIEACIRTASRSVLAEAIVTVRGEDAARFLVAHVVFAEDTVVPIHLRDSYLRQLRSTLPVPSYMRPNAFVELHVLPTGRHGKVDREKLATLDLSNSAWGNQRSTTTLNEAEARMWHLWCDVLPEETVSNTTPTAETDFIEVGGNSLMIVQLHALVQQQTGKRLPLVEMFENTTIGEMTERVACLE